MHFAKSIVTTSRWMAAKFLSTEAQYQPRDSEAHHAGQLARDVPHWPQRSRHRAVTAASTFSSSEPGRCAAVLTRLINGSLGRVLQGANCGTSGCPEVVPS